MEKKLPGVYANRIDKELNNNKKAFYSKEREVKNETNSTGFNSSSTMNKVSTDKNIYQKINEIFSSERYVYKAEVKIQTKSGTLNKKIIGQNNTHLITIDNELIPIIDIIDINFSN